MANPNLLINGGFEQPPVPNTPPTSWSGTGSSEALGDQLLGTSNAVLNSGEFISQTIPSLVAGENYTFQAGLSVSNPEGADGTITVEITGNPTRIFPINNLVPDSNYAMYNFDFIGSSGPVVVTITFNSVEGTALRLDVVSVKLA
ncbi:hypothetical protein [Bacillus thuringiensis]|uniref:hypothetical protein n=1 Tax=Bacillus thuringiensis TaxID=1428 RepID=UPI003B984257